MSNALAMKNALAIRKSRALLVVFLAGVVLVVGGIAATLISRADLAASMSSPSPMETLPVGAYTSYKFGPIWSPERDYRLEIIGAAGVALGILLLVAAVAFWLGKRAARRTVSN